VVRNGGEFFSWDRRVEKALKTQWDDPSIHPKILEIGHQFMAILYYLMNRTMIFDIIFNWGYIEVSIFVLGQLWQAQIWVMVDKKWTNGHMHAKKHNLIDAKDFREDAEILFRETGVLSKFGSGLSLVWRYPSWPLGSEMWRISSRLVCLEFQAVQDSKQCFWMVSFYGQTWWSKINKHWE